MLDQDLAFRSATELVELVATRHVSPVELTQLYFDRIDRLDSQLNSYLLLTHDEAMETAKAAEASVTRGDMLGPLHGCASPVLRREQGAAAQRRRSERGRTLAF